MKADYTSKGELILFPESRLESEALQARGLKAYGDGNGWFLAAAGEAPAVEAPAAPPAEEPAPPAAPDRKAVIAELEALGVEFKPRARTENLVKLLAESKAEAPAEEPAAPPSEDTGSQHIPTVEELQVEARNWVGQDEKRVKLITDKIKELGGEKVSELDDQARVQLQAFIWADAESPTDGGIFG